VQNSALAESDNLEWQFAASACADEYVALQSELGSDDADAAKWFRGFRHFRSAFESEYPD